MKRLSIFPRLTAAALALVLALSPAQALTVEQARTLLRENYVDPIDQAVLDLPTVPAILEALGDPYTEYFTPQAYTDFLASMEDTAMGGIGVTAAMTDQGMLVDEVADGSPSQRAGIRPGDLLVAVDGQSILGLEQNEAAARIRGPEGSTARITYLRQGREHTVTLTRATIILPATTGALLEGGVGYIDCDTWGEDTLGHFRELMDQMGAQANCWLIDLRFNTGGLSDAAADVAGLFCGPGNKLSLRLRDEDPAGDYVYYTYDTQVEAATDKPVVLLVDGYTASASEAFAAALRDYDRAVIVGSRTFGKGVAQGVWDRDSDPDYFPDGDSLKITVARFYSPVGNTNHIVGVMPDLLVDDSQTEAVGYDLAKLLAQAGEGWPLAAQLVVQQRLADGPFFSDVTDDTYQLSVDTLALYGLVSGKGDGLFHPQDTLTRAELAQLLQNALGYLAQNDAAFDDVAADAWYAPAVAAMDDLGLMTGVGQDSFAPQRALTRQELFTVLGRLGRWLNDDLDFALRGADQAQLDLRVLRDYAPWARESVWLLSCALEDGEGGLINLLWDDPDQIDPTTPATRGEAALGLYSLLYYLDILP